jgi:hypothetical protein
LVRQTERRAVPAGELDGLHRVGLRQTAARHEEARGRDFALLEAGERAIGAPQRDARARGCAVSAHQCAPMPILSASGNISAKVDAWLGPIGREPE